MVNTKRPNKIDFRSGRKDETPELAEDDRDDQCPGGRAEGEAVDTNASEQCAYCHRQEDENLRGVRDNMLYPRHLFTQR